MNEEAMRMQRGMNENYRKDKITQINSLGNHIIESIKIGKITQNEIITSDEVKQWTKEAESIIKGFYGESITDFRSIYNAKKEEQLTYTKFKELRSCFRKTTSLEV